MWSKVDSPVWREPPSSKAAQKQAAREGAPSSASARLTSLYVQLGFADIVVGIPAQHLHLHLGGSGSWGPTSLKPGSGSAGLLANTRLPPSSGFFLSHGSAA